MSTVPHHRRALAAAALSALALTAPAIARAQASVGARLESNLTGGCGRINSAGAPSGSPTSMAWVEDYSVNGCVLHASGFAYLGVAGANAKAAWNTTDAASGGIQAFAGGDWSDVLHPALNARYTDLLGARRMTMTVKVGAHGTAQAADIGDPGAGGSATINYQLNVGGQVASGTQTASSYDGSHLITGEWGTITRSVDMFAILLSDGTYDWSSVSLNMFGQASAGVGKLFQGGNFADVAFGDFGHTLVWEGVESVKAYDANGNEIQLGADAGFTLTGAQTGFDYTNAAVEVVTATPEPSSAILLATGVVALVAWRRRSS